MKEHTNFNPYLLFADRIGGSQFGKTNKVFKFTLIDNAKKEFSAKNPDVKVIDMGVGEPEERAPDVIVESLYKEALDKENRIYPNNGTLPFKEAAARYLKRLLNLDFDPTTEIVHCVGSKTALAEVPLAFLNPGENVCATAPGYPVLPTMADWLGAKIEYLKLYAKNSYLPDLRELEDLLQRQKIKILLLNYPNNPTGGVANLKFYEKVVEFAHRYQFLIVQDAAYSDLVHTSNFFSPFQVHGGRDVTIELYSLSKSYNMQGYRIGFVVSNPLLLKAFALAKDNIDNGQFIAIQKAGMFALDNQAAFLVSNRKKYFDRLSRVTEILRKAGIDAQASAGTFYLYCPVPKEFHGQTFSNAQSFCDYLIQRFGIITVPWEEAGPHLRFSMTFPVGTKDFKTETDVYTALEARLLHQSLQ